MPVLPPHFIKHWKDLMAYHRSRNGTSRTVWRQIIRDWRLGKPVPGYDTAPPPGPSGIPYGWSYANLMRHSPSVVDLTIAAPGNLPKIS